MKSNDLHKQVHDKRGIAESLHVYTNKARQTVCEVGEFLREISRLLKIRLLPSLKRHRSPSPTGVFSRDYGNKCTEWQNCPIVVTRCLTIAKLW